MPTSQRDFIRRIDKIAVEKIDGDVFIARSLGADVTVKSGTGRVGFNFSVPACGSADDFDLVGRSGLRILNRVYEVAIAFQRASFDFQIEFGFCWSIVSRQISARRRRLKLSERNFEQLSIVLVADRPVAIDRNVVFGDVFLRIPLDLRRNIEMLEGAAPRLDRIGRQYRIPMQFIDGKVQLFDRRHHLRESHPVDARFRLEEQVIPQNRHAAFHRAAESLRQKLFTTSPLLSIVTSPRLETPDA